MRYEPENILVQKMQEGTYQWKDYIRHHSRELNDEYERYCKFHGINPDEEESAERFIDMREQQFEEALKHGEA